MAAAFWFMLALLFALVEIEIEGDRGWAENLPTWYRTDGVTARLYALFTNGKPLTGYHAFLFPLTFLIHHAGFAQGLPWTLRAEIVTVGSFFLWAAVWDFLWFVLHPRYGIRRFRPRHIWWHAKAPWLFDLLPLDYAFALLAGGSVHVAAWFWGDAGALSLLLRSFLTYAAGIALSVLLAPTYRRWYFRMRQRDDRARAIPPSSP